MVRCADPEDTADAEELSALRPGDGIELVRDGADTVAAVRLSDRPGNALSFVDGELYGTDTGDGTGGSGGTTDPGTVAYTHTQATPGTVWTVTHELGFDPAGSLVYSADGYLLDGYGVQIMTPGRSLRLSFDLAFAGTAYFS